MASTEINSIERLRKENLDQFFTLVRMHLSFVVDINIDDVDNSADKPKQFRWNFHKKTKNSSNVNQNNLSSVKNSDSNSMTQEGISRVNELIDFLSKDENIVQEGIFRRTGSLNRQNELRMRLLSGSELKLEQGKFSVHDCASVLKGFLAELPQPLLMDQYYQTYCTLAVQYPPHAESSEAKLLMALQLLFLLLTPLHRNFLQSLLRLLKAAADNETSNRMSPDTLATMFTPHLLCPRKLSPEAFHADSLALAPMISFMIRHSEKLFEPPKQLATDVAAYFTIRERKKMLSPDVDLDESITDRTAASTVYTFVDRRRTGAENASNNTDAALAQLYAHIQALPDSQHKRRLIKQFNRQNGYGTPIQIQRTGKVAGSKSFGDSIKRHIFHKGLLNRTPKKMGSAITINSVEEKISFISKEKLKHTDESNNSLDVCHRNIVMKNLANRIASTESLHDNVDFDSDASNDSTISENAILNRSHKLSPKFVSEPNLSSIDNKDDNETPKIGKKHSRLFRSKLTTQNLNRKYIKKAPIRGTPTCVTCFEDLDSESDNEILPNKKSNSEATPRKVPKSHSSTESVEVECEEPLKLHYLTSTPGVSDVYLDDKCMTPYTMNFRRASMSPITKSTQKLSKAMQESIMTPRSRKPLVITSEQRDNQATTEEIKPDSTYSSETIFQSLSPKNDSDFISSDEENISSLHHSDDSKRNTHELNTKFLDTKESKLHVLGQKSQYKSSSLTEPFREYLLSRSVLTANPVDLSLLNKTNDMENPDDVISESLMYCLDGNAPSDLTSSIGSLAVGSMMEIDKSNSRSPLKNLNSFVNIDLSSPNRKRTAKSIFKSKCEENVPTQSKRVIIEKENFDFDLRETDL